MAKRKAAAEVDDGASNDRDRPKPRRSTRRTRKRSPYFVTDDEVAERQLKGRKTKLQAKKEKTETTAKGKARKKPDAVTVKPEDSTEVRDAQSIITERQPISADRFGLLQELYMPDPFRVMLVALFCNQTPGKRARPFLAELLVRWPTVESLADADWQDIAQFIQPLGLFNTRARRIVALAQAYLEAPPVLGETSKRKGLKWYPPTEVSHLPGAGPYAMDCYRIFCTPDGWRTCRPLDKELKVYVKRLWAKE